MVEASSFGMCCLPLTPTSVDLEICDRENGKKADTMNSAKNQPHPDVATLIAFHFGRLEAKERAAIERHLTLCKECSGRLAVSVNSTDNSWTQQTSKTESPALGEDPVCIPPPLEN